MVQVTTGLRLEDVAVNFGALRAVDGVSFELAQGEICGLVGPNGSGKTTLLNAISGVRAPTAGHVWWDGKDVTRLPSYGVARRGIARTFQLVRLMRRETVRENVHAGLYWRDRQGGRSLRRERKSSTQKIDAAIERAGLSRYRDHLVSTLPFGIQRRVELARAVVSEPDLVLLDEPAAGISESDLEDLGILMRQEVERGCSVILVDHHLRFVLDVCPRLVVMNYGQKLFDGEADAAVNDPSVREAYVGT